MKENSQRFFLSPEDPHCKGKLESSLDGPNKNIPREITVLGAGSWGTVLSHLLVASGHQVYLWARSENFVRHVVQTGRFTRPVEITLPDSIHLTSDLAEAIEGADVVLCAIPSEGVPDMIHSLQQLNAKFSLLISATKGLAKESGLCMTELWERAFPCKVAALSGPNLSAEAALAKPMRTMIAAKHLTIAQEAAALFKVAHFKVQLTDDLLGLEMTGALKNVIALAAGAWDGLNLGSSGKGAMFTRAVDELAGFVQLVGGRKETAHSVAGIGDLYITCSSPLSRNYQTGYGLGVGKSLEQIGRELKGQVAEGVWNAPLLYELAQKHKAQFRLCKTVYEMLQLDLSEAENKYKLEEMFIALV